jgi:hypothetical protein
VFAIAGHCGVPAGAVAITANVSALQPSARGSLVVTAAGVASPGVTVSFRRGQVRATTQATIALTGNPQGSVAATARLNGRVGFMLAVLGFYE